MICAVCHVWSYQFQHLSDHVHCVCVTIGGHLVSCKYFWYVDNSGYYVLHELLIYLTFYYMWIIHDGYFISCRWFILSKCSLLSVFSYWNDWYCNIYHIIDYFDWQITFRWFILRVCIFNLWIFRFLNLCSCVLFSHLTLISKLHCFHSRCLSPRCTFVNSKP